MSRRKAGLFTPGRSWFALFDLALAGIGWLIDARDRRRREWT